MGEEFQGGVIEAAWWNPNLFSGGGGGFGGLSSPCSVAQLGGGGGGGGYDMGSFGWPHEISKGKFNNSNSSSNNNQDYDDNNFIFSAEFDTNIIDNSGFGLSPTSSTTDSNQFYKMYDLTLLLQDKSYDSTLSIEGNMMSSKLPYEMSSTIFPSQDESPPMTTTTSSNSDSSTIINSEGGLTTSFPINSSASYLLQTLFDDDVDESQLINPINYESTYMDSQVLLPQSSFQLPQSDIKFDRGTMNMLSSGGQISNCDYNTATALSNIRASLLNSTKSRSRAPTFTKKSQNSANLTKLKHEDIRHESKKSSSNDQLTPKRPRIETPSSLPTFKVRKEKLGDRVTALQQLVSPFGKTDTASVLHEAIEYIKFLHDQVHVFCTPYLKNEVVVQHQRLSEGNEDVNKLDLRSRGLCLVPISSTYPVTQETPVDFWTPTFGGTTTFK